MHSLKKAGDLDALLNDIGERTVVMLGEASHGTHEYYTWRTAITKRLIEEKGFSFVAVEGDWPDCYELNCFAKGYLPASRSVLEVLRSFDRWPTWMWANWETAALSGWLSSYNGKLDEETRVGFYGLDVYSLWDSMKAMMHYLEKEDAPAFNAIRNALSCFEPYEGNEHLYARYSLTDHSCRDKVLNLLREVRSAASREEVNKESAFNAEQNALIAVNAEKYYSSMIRFDNESWNIRDGHMMESLDRLLRFYGPGSKAIVWAHNTHIGDARATGMQRAGMVNLGQLAREAYGINKVYLVGFGSYSGTVIAAGEWGAPMQKMKLPPAREDSIEGLLHRYQGTDHYLLMNTGEDRRWQGKFPHRAVGVVYDPATDRYRNYVASDIGNRYNAFVFLNETSALHPFQLTADPGKMPDMYPFGL
ncbi:MAG TPA: erythromycin esterase family protein [Flavisolibacter sp.]|nr:erythromycin esterase family protein [Flavisolibacter sp.]